MSRSSVRVRALAAAAAPLLLLCAFLALAPGCRGGSDSSDEPTPRPAESTTASPSPDTTAAPAPQDTSRTDAPALAPSGTAPQPVGTWPARYAPLLRSDAVLVGLIEPRAASDELERALEALAQVDAATATRLRRALEQGLGQLAALLDPTAWPERGFDPGAALLVQLTAGDGSGIDAAADQVAQLLAADDPAQALSPATRDALARSGLGLRIALPVAELDVASAFIDSALPTLGATPTDPVAGYDSVWTVDGRALLGVVRARDFIFLDAAFEPWLAEADRGEQLGLQRRLLEGLGAAAPPADGPGLPGPRSSEPSSAFVAVDLERLGRVDAVALLATAGSPPSEGRVLAARLSQRLIQRGPYRALAIELASGTGITVSAYFARRHDELFAELAAQPAVRVDAPLAALGFAPSVMATDGTWAAAGLGPAPEVELGTLIRVLDEGSGVLPLLVPVWMSAVPALVWRDLVPTPARFVKPGAIERVELVVGDAFSKDTPALALMVVDVDGQLDTHRHGLACLTQRRPVQGRCRDDEIEVGKRASTRFGDTQLHYLIESREVDGHSLVVLVASLDAALLSVLADAPLAPSAALGRMRLDLERLAQSGAAQLLGEPLAVAAQLLGAVDAEVTLDPDGLHWTASFARAASLAHVAGVIAPSVLGFLERGREVEALLHLEALAVSAVAWRDGSGKGKYPPAGTAVCSAGGRLDGERVPPDAAAWQASPWRELAFAIELPHLYRYCYQSTPDGSRYAAWAEASLQGATRDSRLCISSEVDASSGEALVGRVRRLEGEERCFVP